MDTGPTVGCGCDIETGCETAATGCDATIDCDGADEASDLIATESGEDCS